MYAIINISISTIYSLETVVGNLLIENNDGLTSSTGLKNITEVGSFYSAGTIDIINNILLNTCNSVCPFLLNLPYIASLVTIENNTTGCNSWQEIIANSCANTLSLCEEDTIQTNAIINSGDTIQYLAKTRIQILSGFHVDQGANFKAYICEE